ncbi:transposase [Brucella sp. TWI432]
MLYVLRVGRPWRDMHERYGKWNSVMSDFDAWRNRAYGMLFWKHSSSWA